MNWTHARDAWKWLREHVDATLLIAAAVEIPRWCSTFAAINEPLIVGIPLGALLAYATSVAWKAYFENNARKGLALLNLAGLAIAIAVITPVLFALTESHVVVAEGEVAHTPVVNLTKVLSWELRWGWSGLLAITTFMPLIQLAAAKHATGVSATTAAAQGGKVDATTPTPVLPAEIVSAVTMVAPDASQLLADQNATTGAQLPTDATPSWAAVVAQPTNSARRDDKTQLILDAIKDGAHTPYAIEKRTGIARTTLYRDGKGWLPQLVAAGKVRNGDGTYKLVDAS